MTRLWDKGAPLDARVLHYTAGEDHALDDRLVAYDVQASIAHAEALAELTGGTLRFIDDAYVLIMLDQPEATAEAIGAFLRETASAES